jgi:hypothetical protein
MKIQQAIKLYRSGKLHQIEIRRNPGDIRQWFVMVSQTDGIYLMLADENDNPVVEETLEKLVEKLKKIGFREARIIF